MSAPEGNQENHVKKKKKKPCELLQEVNLPSIPQHVYKFQPATWVLPAALSLFASCGRSWGYINMKRGVLPFVYYAD